MADDLGTTQVTNLYEVMKEHVAKSNAKLKETAELAEETESEIRHSTRPPPPLQEDDDDDEPEPRGEVPKTG